MKKLSLLLLFSVLTSFLFAQVNLHVTPQTKLPVIKGAHLISPVAKPLNDEVKTLTPTQVSQHSTSNHISKTSGVRNLTTTIIGSTVYDLQSNGAISTRLWNNAGKLSAVWTYSNGSPPSYPDRGTGYAYYDGTTWSPP